jgi:VCBS repeat-containing protein
LSLAGKFTDVLSDAHGSHPHGPIHVDSVSTHAPVDAIIVPDAHLLFHGDFKRSGVDLVLTSGDREVVLHEYFKGEKRAALASPDGAHLTGDIVNALSGHTQFAQADGSASVAPAIIGHVTKLAGNATAIRNGVSIILNQGDTVHKGDVVQSGSDSTLGITFIDGTVFGLASSAKMVLNEMIYDPNGSDNKSLLSLVQGTISFVAGATAKKGDMKIDTPVATMGIRGTAVLVEIDFEVPSQGGAPPAKFQVLVEPDGTTGSYILFDKTTLTPIATVSQAGTQTIINGQGTVSFVSSAQLSPDAQRVISDVFSLKFSQNDPNTKLTNNSNGSIDPQTLFLKLASNDVVPVTLQFLNLPDKPVAPPGTDPGPSAIHIAGPPKADASDGSLSERTAITGSAAVDSISGIVAYADINPDDVPSVQAAFSSFVYGNAQQVDVTATLTAEQLAAIKAIEVPLVVVQDPNGKNTGQATWTYTIADGAFDFLAAGETVTLTYMARVDNNYGPSNETTFVPFTIVITGTNDKPTLSATGGTITERTGTGNTAVDTVTGSVAFTDVDLTDRPIVSAAISTTDPFRYYDADGNDVTATLTPAQLAAILAVEVPLSVVQAAGNTHNGSATWTYSIEDSKFDFIAKGETLTLNYVAQVDDGQGGVVSTPITVSIHGADVVVTGTNDVPTIATTSGAFTERLNIDQPNPTGSTALDTVSGTISFTDVDLTDRPVASAAFTSYTYLNAADASLTLTAGQLDAVDATLTVVQASGNTHNGSADWTYSVPDSAFDFLADGEILTLTYTATVNDGHGGIVTKPLTVTVTGTNDTAAITSALQTGTISEIAGASGSATPDTANGTIKFTDVDSTDTHAVTITKVTASGIDTGLADHDTQFGWLTLGALTDSVGVLTGAQKWTFSAPDHYFDYLADTETVTLTYTVQIDDYHGGITSQDVVVTVNGSNDAPEVAADISGVAGLHAITEQTAVTGSTDLDSATGSLAFRDVDLSDTHTFGSSKPAFGWSDANGNALTLDATQRDVLTAASALTLTPHDSTGTGLGSVDFSYSAADNAFDFLADGEKLTVTYDITVTDEHNVTSTQPVTITVTGTNDGPVAVADTDTGHIVEAGNDSYNNAVFGISTTTGDVLANDTDVDLSDTHEVVGVVAGTTSSALSTGVGTTIVGTYGSLVLNANGTWTYTLDNNNPLTNALAQGTHASDIFSYTESDHHGGTSTTTLTIDITGTNDAPVTNAAPVAVTDVNAGAPVVEQGVMAGVDAATGNVLSNDSDVDTGDSKTVQGVASGTVTGPLTGQVATSVDGIYGSVTIDADGTWTYALDNDRAATGALTQDEHVSDVFTYTMHDTLGSTASATLTIDITGTNDAPVVTSDGGGATAAISVAENSTGVTTVHAGDVDGPSMTYSIIGGGDSPDAAKFAIDSVTGALSFVTAPNFESTASAEGNNVYTVQVNAADGAGGFDVQTIIVTVTDVEEAPVAIDDSIAGASEDSTLAIASSTLLANDAAGDGDGLTVSSFDQTSAKGATLMRSGTNIIYDPTHAAALQALAAGETTTDTFTYTVSDGQGGTDTATVTVALTGVNDAPVVQTGMSVKQASLASNQGHAVFDGQAFFGSSELIVSDVDHNARFGIAITSVDNANGSWEYQASPGGPWIQIELQDGKALLLSADVKVRFNGAGSGDTEHLTFRAWDGTDGSASGTMVSLQETGGTTAFSSGTYSIGAKNVVVIDTTQFTITEDPVSGTTTVSSLSVTDAEAGADELFTVTTTTKHGGSTATTSASSDHLPDIAGALGNGVTYHPGTPEPVTDMVTLEVTDGFGAADTVHFIFNQAGTGPVTLTGTSGKDVIFATGYNDTLTGGAGADQFVFAPEDTINSDTITDFDVARDKIDVRQFGNINSWTNISAVQQGNDTLITLDSHTNVLLKNVVATSLHASDFIVHG